MADILLYNKSLFINVIFLMQEDVISDAYLKLPQRIGIVFNKEYDQNIPLCLFIKSLISFDVKCYLLEK